MSFRKEKKVKLLKSESEIIKIELSNLGMKKLYPKRYTSSCYFDSKDLICFHESEEGVLPRRKVRIRWYDNKPNFFKEEKISSIEGRFKTSKSFNQKSFFDIFNLEINSKYYGLLKPSLIVNYQREFYTYLGARITFDTNINYLNPRNITKNKFFDQESVMEIKTSTNISDDFLSSILPFPESRFSKYCRGILSQQRAI